MRQLRAIHASIERQRGLTPARSCVATCPQLTPILCQLESRGPRPVDLGQNLRARSQTPCPDDCDAPLGLEELPSSSSVSPLRRLQRPSSADSNVHRAHVYGLTQSANGSLASWLLAGAWPIDCRDRCGSGGRRVTFSRCGAEGPPW